MIRIPPRSVQIGVLILCLSTVASSMALAQRPLRYQPSTPTVSPYLNLTRRDFGGVPNYYAFVRPLQRQQAALVQEQALRVQQSRELEELQTEIRLGQTESTATTGTGSWFFNPGTRARYMDSTQYYPQTAPPSRRGGVRVARPR